jgi:hypothetical protein
MKKILITFFVVLCLNVASSVVARSENPQPGQDEGSTFKAAEKMGNVSQDQNQFFSPLKPNSEGSFLILDPDGKTPSDYEKFLSPPDRLEKKPDR